MAVYSQRRNLFETAEWVWSVQDGGIGVCDHTGAKVLARWENIASVRVAHAPTRYKPWRHLMELRMTDGAKLTVDNVQFKGLANFEDRSDTYAPFVRAALDAIAVKAPQARAMLGATPVGYWLSVVFLAVVAVALAMILMAVPIDGIPGVAWIKMGIIAFFIPQLVIWAVKARPRGVELGAIPDSALPAAVRRAGAGPEVGSPAT